jgi:hypothetical protein
MFANPDFAVGFIKTHFNQPNNLHVTTNLNENITQNFPTNWITFYPEVHI